MEIMEINLVRQAYGNRYQRSREQVQQPDSSGEEGAEVILTRRGIEVAYLVPSAGKTKRLPSLKKFRAAIKLSGKPLSETISEGRHEERY